MLSIEEKKRLVELHTQLEEHKNNNKLSFYQPYPYQKRFHNLGKKNNQRLLMAANRVGKTYSGAVELSYHLTGLYPAWWKGKKFAEPIRAWCGGESNETTRDVCQRELFGQPDDPSSFGTGAIPKSCIVDSTRKPGVPNAFNSVIIRHVSGGTSRVGFKAYEMGYQKWMAEKLHVIWLDEEPDQSIYSQAVTRTADTGGLVYMTFTPESGVTNVVSNFLHDIKKGQALIQASWDDAPHLDKDTKEQILGALPAHERELRSRGIPVLGSGLVYPIPPDDIRIEPFKIPSYYKQICGLDFGWDHPTAAVWIALDPDTDIAYVYDVYRERKESPIIHGAAIKTRGEWIPVMWPHDGMRQDGQTSGVTLADQYRKQGIPMHYEKFSNPPAPGQKEGQGGNSIEPGVFEIMTRMQTGRFKVFSNCPLWFEEFQMYHRKDGKIVAERDDLMSATRYAMQSLRFARTEEVRLRSETADYDFDPYGE